MPIPPTLATLPLDDLASAQAVVTHIEAEATATGIALPPPPPVPTTCCGRGCNGCVWEGYFGAVGYWRDEALLMLDA